MKRFTRLGLAAGCAAAALLLGTSAFADCVKIAGTESSGEKLSLDPADQISGHDATLVYAVYDRFVDLNDLFEVEPALAESWESSDGGKVWTFKLREGVTFHDGSTLDADDVVYSFRRLLDPTVGSGAAASILDFLTPEGIEAVDEYTVRFTSAEPVAEMPLLLANKFNLVVPDGMNHETLRTNGVGTGPYMVTETLDPSKPVQTFAAFADYWQGAPKAECLDISVISESLTAVSAIKSGDIDLRLSLDPAVLGTVADDENVTLLETGAGTSMTLTFDVTQAPFDDVKVRQALKAVVDRQAMLDTALLGVGELGNDNPVPPSWPSAYTSEIKPQDVELAKSLLADAGHGDGLDIDLYTSDALPGMVKMAQLYQQMAAEAGINVNIQVTPADSYWDDIWMQRPAFSSGWSIRPPAEGLSVAYAEESSWNETQWRDPDFQALLSNGKTEIDDAKRAQFLMDAQQMLSEEGGVIIPLFIHQVAGLRANCSGYQPHAQNFNIDYHELTCE